MNKYIEMVLARSGRRDPDPRRWIEKLVPSVHLFYEFSLSSETLSTRDETI